nr:hypothetical protein [Tanacetum cinerariifolium]
MGFVYVNFSDYERKMVNDVNVEIHGVKFNADFVVSDYVNEEEPSIVFGRDFLVTTKSQVDFGLGEIRINLTKFKEGIDVIDLTKKVGSSSGEFVKMGNTNQNKSYNINKLTPPPSFLKAKRNSTNFHCSTTTDIPSPNPKAKGENKRGVRHQYKELEESKPIIEVLENYVIYKKKLDEILIGRGMLCIDDGVVRHTYFTKPRTKSYVESFEMEGENDWLGSFKVGRDEDGNVKYGLVAPSFI